MKKIISILLLLILLSDLSIHFLLFKIKQKEIKRAVKELIFYNVPESNLQKFEFSKDKITQLNWVEPREFKLNDIMYDVLKSDTIDGKIKLVTYQDKDETNLIASFKDLVNGKLSDKINTLIKSKLLNFDGFTQDFFFIELKPQTRKKNFIFYKDKLTSNYLNEFLIPPELI